MSIRERAMMLTGMAFPLGSLLGVWLGRSTAPAASGGGFQDIVWTIFWFVAGAPLLTLLVYALATRTIEMDRQARIRAAGTEILGIVVGSLALYAALIVNARTGQQVSIVIGLLLGGALVALFTRRALRT